MIRRTFVTSVGASIISLLAGFAPAASSSLPFDASPAAGSVKVSKCTVEKPLTLQQASVLVGLKKRNARLLATENYGWGFRVGERNGEGLAVTTDYQPCRVTVAVKKGRVTKVLQVG